MDALELYWRKKPRSYVEFRGRLGRLWKLLELMLAGGLGFEPRLAESESAVLPLDDPPRVGKLNAEQGVLPTYT